MRETHAVLPIWKPTVSLADIRRWSGERQRYVPIHVMKLFNYLSITLHPSSFHHIWRWRFHLKANTLESFRLDIWTASKWKIWLHLPMSVKINHGWVFPIYLRWPFASKLSKCYTIMHLWQEMIVKWECHK